MTLEQALENITVFTPPLARKEIRCIRENRAQAIPELLNILARSIAQAKGFSDEAYGLYALYLLAEFKVPEALELYIRILELDEERCDFILGDVLTEGMDAIVASVATQDDTPRLVQILENKGLDVFQRLSVLRGLVIMYVTDTIARPELLQCIGSLLSREDECEELLAFVASTCLDIGAVEYFPRIRELFAMDKIERRIVGVDEFDEASLKMHKNGKLARGERISEYTVITDTIAALRGFACFRSEKAEWAPGSPMLPPS